MPNFFAEAIKQARAKQTFDLWAYVLMPEHVHLLIKPQTEVYSISAILQSIKQSVSRKAIKHLSSSEPEKIGLLATGQKQRPYRLWQAGGGYDRNIVQGPALRSVVDYIHNNPVRRGLVEQPSEWFWSSAAEWEGLQEGPIRVDQESLMQALS